MRRRDFLALGLTAATAAALPIGATATATQARLPQLAARPADSLVDSYMINTKIFYESSVYGHTEAVVDLVKELGARVVRERCTTGTSLGTRNQKWAFPQLAKAGVRWHATVGELTDWQNATAVNQDVMRFLAANYEGAVGGDLAAVMHSLSGCNEIDGAVMNGQVDPNWAAHARTMQQALWTQAKANPSTRTIPVAGPGTRTDVTPARAAQLGSLDAWTDWGNGHLYNKGTSPTREIDEHLRILEPCFPTATQWVMSETGYNNSPQDNLGKTVPEEASAAYAIRGLCDFFARNTIYGRFELLDDPDAIDYSSQQTINNTADREAHFGLVAMTRTTTRESTPDTWRKKPEFAATRNLLHLLADPGPRFSTDPLQVTVTGGGADLQTLLLQKRNGTHYLLLWRDVDVCRYTSDGPVFYPVPPDDVTVVVAPQRPVAIYSPSRQAGAVAVQPASTPAHRVEVGGMLMVLEIG